jgi:hypothetical protein
MLLSEQRNCAAYHPWSDSYVRTKNDRSDRLEDR